MTDALYGNVTSFERLARLVVGGILIAVIFNPGVSAYWLALLAVYPIITAIMAWDPLYALMDQLKSHMPVRRAGLKHATA